MHRARSLCVAVGIIVSLLAIGAGCKKKKPNPAIAQYEDAWTTVERGVSPSGELTKDGALAAFSLSIAALPGVKTPPRDASIPSCGTLPVHEIRHFIGALTTEQRDVVTKALTPPKSPPVKNAVIFGVSTAELNAAYAGAAKRLEEHFGAPLRERVLITTVPSAFPPAPALGGGDGGAAAQDNGGDRTLAYHTVWCPNAVGGDTDPFDPQEHNVASGTQSFAGCSHLIRVVTPFIASKVEGVLAHQLVHAYQAENYEGVAANYYAPETRWYIEGFAGWVTTTLYPTSNDTRYRSRYAQGNLAGEFSLLTSDYEGVGLFSHLAARGVDVKGRGLNLVNSPDPVSAFRELIAGADDAVTDWASSTVRDAAQGTAWTLPFTVDPLTPPRGFREVDPVLAGKKAITLETPRTSQLTTRIPIADDVDVLEIAVTGYGRARLGAADLTWRRPKSRAFCRTGNCPCPDPACAPLESAAKSDLLVGLSGAGTSSSLVVRGFTHKDWLKQPQSKNSCGPGKYNLDPDSMKAAAAAKLPAAQHVTNITGSIRFTLEKGGSCQAEVEDFGVEIETGVGASASQHRTVLRGSQSGKCTLATNGGTLTYIGPPPALSTRNELKLSGQWANAPPDYPSTIPPGLVGMTNAVSARYRCHGPHLVLFTTDGKETFWTREPGSN